VSAQSDALDALALCRRTHATLKRSIARHQDAAEVLAKLDKPASFACECAARRLLAELALVKLDLRRVEFLAEMMQGSSERA